MAFPVWLDNLIAYSLQIAILASAGTLLAHVFRLRVPRVSLIYWQALLLACLLLPALQNWKHAVIVQERVETGMVSAVAIDGALPAIPSAPVSPQAKFTVPSVVDIIIYVFLAGFVGRLLWLGLGLLRLRLFLRRSSFVPAKDAGAHAISSQIGTRARFFVSDHVNSPATFGFLDPAVILPRSFNQLSHACREAVICHELLHVRRRDWAVILVEEIVRSIFWFHPAVWWLLAKIHLSREQWIDYEVVRLTGNKQPYLESLLEIAEACGRPKAVPAPLFLRERHLVQRVALLLKEASMHPCRLALSVAGIIILLTGTVRLASAWFPFNGEPVLIKQPLKMQSKVVQMPDSIKPDIAVQKVKPSEKRSPVAPATKAPKASQSAFLPLAGAPVLSPAPVPNQDNSRPARDPIRVGGGVQESKLIRRVEPIYPELAKRSRVSGRVVLTITVDEEGSVADVQVLNGHPLLNDAAVAAVKQWRYSPTLLNGAPVPVIATVTVIFALRDDSGVVAAGPTQLEQEYAAKKALLAQLMERYTPNHPQVVAVQRELEMLENQIQNQRAAAYGSNTTVQITGMAPPLNTQRAFAQFMATIQRDPTFGAISLSMSPAGETSPPVGEAFIPPQLDFDIERLHSLMKAGGWDSIQTKTEEVSPSGARYVRMLSASFSFVLSEAGEISNVRRTGEIEIPGMEQQLSLTHVLAVGRRGARAIPVNCTISFSR